MTSIVQIWNMAMGHLGIDALIQSQEEKSLQANACRRYWAASRDSVLSAYDWNFARKYAELSQLSNTIPTTKWTYMYGLPTDCLAARYIDDGSRGKNDRIAYEIFLLEGTRKAFLCDLEEVTLCYTAKVEDPNMFDPQFVESVSLYLAAQTCMQVTRKANMKGYLLQQARGAIEASAAQNLNEEKPDPDREPASIRARL
jgi:hypothetical protein